MIDKKTLIHWLNEADSEILRLRSEISRLQNRVSQMGAEIASLDPAIIVDAEREGRECIEFHQRMWGRA